MIQSASILLYLFVALSNLVSFDKTVHDFGRVEASSDPLVCVYTFRNVSDSDVRVKYARASCSCLSLVWTTDVVSPGECGNVIAKYTRQYGESRFDKSFKVVFDGDAGSFDLSVKGFFYETPTSLASRFPVERSPLLFDRAVLDAGNVSPGGSRLVCINVANISGDAVSVSFDDLPPFAKLNGAVDVASLDVGEAVLELSPDAPEWGLHDYHITPLSDGVRLAPLTLRVLIIKDFSGLSAEEKYSGSYPFFPEQSFRVSKNRIRLEIPFRNTGKQPLHILAADFDVPGVTCEFPSEVSVGADASLRCAFSPSFFDSSQDSCTLYIVSDSPVNPVVRIELDRVSAINR